MSKSAHRRSRKPADDLPRGEQPPPEFRPLAPPKKDPILLAIAVVLVGLWMVALLVMALGT